MRALNVLLAIVVSIVLGLAVFEIGLRLINKGPAPDVMEFDDHLGWRKHAGLKVHRKGPEYSVTLETNEFGLADDPMPTPAKPADTFRMIALGDSFTQGFTVDRKDLFVDILENWWKEEGRKADIVNAGCEAYSTDQEVVWLLDNGAKFQPDLVVMFAYENDIYWNGSPTYEARNTEKPLFRPNGELESGTLKDVGPRPWYETSAIGLLLRPFVADRSSAAQYYFTPEGCSVPVDKEFSPLFKKEPDFLANSLQRTEGAFLALKKKCDELKARAIVVAIPSHSVIDSAYAQKFAETRLGSAPSDLWSPDKPVDTLLALAKQAGLETLDPRKFLKDRAAAGEKLYFDVDWHLNKNGNRVLAEYLHTELDRMPEAKMPPSFRAKTVVAAPTAVEEESALAGPLKLFAFLWIALSALFIATYKEENKALAPLKIGALLAAVFTIAIGGQKLIALLPPKFQQAVGILVVLALFVFIVYKLGRRVGTILELVKSFVVQGHWYLMPLIVVLLSIGSLLVVAASSPFVAPFIYTLF